MLDNKDDNDSLLPWERGYYGTKDGREIGLPDGTYEIIGEGNYRRLPADPGSE
jgi:hypothetical protein